MLQASDHLPDVPRRPAPWDLAGSGWIVAVKLLPDSPARDAFLPSPLAGRGTGRLSFLVYADYAVSNCGPYRELLFIPGRYPFMDGSRHYTISRILVSTWDSVVNGRLNWGIPKDPAEFDVATAAGGTRETCILLNDSRGREVCRLLLARARLAPRMPLRSGLLPGRLRTLAQRFEGRDYYYAPQSSGWIRPGRLLDWRFDGRQFPDLAGSRVVAACEVESFRMRFPVARID